jgi:fumarate hydratase class II
VCAGSLHDEMSRSIVKEAQGHLARRDVEDWALHVWGTPSGTSVDDAKRLIADLVSQFAGGVAGMDAVQVRSRSQS